jgi:hypothetical protein
VPSSTMSTMWSKSPTATAADTTVGKPTYGTSWVNTSDLGFGRTVSDSTQDVKLELVRALQRHECSDRHRAAIARRRPGLDQI